MVDKQRLFEILTESVGQCRLCARMVDRTRVMTEKNGNIYSKVLFIAEAPGRLGADRTKIPLYGDQTGRNFSYLLQSIGWKRDEVFITNALLCNPLDEYGNNSPPTLQELANCKLYLSLTIDLINPDIIVTLGNQALRAIYNIWPHSIKLKNDVSKVISWNGRLLMPLYHSGPRALIYRSAEKQKLDFLKLSKIVDPVSGKKDKLYSQIEPKIPSKFYEAIILILSEIEHVSFFKLTKLLYLIDLKSIQHLGYSITSSTYLRAQEGPWIPSLAKEIKELNRQDVITSLQHKPSKICLGPSRRTITHLSTRELEVIVEVLNTYGDFTDSLIKTAVYKSTPMQYILHQEREGRSMSRVSVIHKDKLISSDT